MSDSFAPMPGMIYDRIRVVSPASVSSFLFFRDPQGLFGKTRADTNLILYGYIPDSMLFRVEGVILHATRPGLWDDSDFQLIVNDASYISVGCKAARIAGLAQGSRGVNPIVLRNNLPYYAVLNLISAVEDSLTVTAILTGTFYPQGATVPPLEIPMFAWILQGDELPEWAKPEAFETVRLQEYEEPPSKPQQKRQTGVVAGVVRARPETRKLSTLTRIKNFVGKRS